MVISDEQSYPILIDNIDSPTLTEHFWVLDLEMFDFTLTPLVMFEELTVETLEVLINGYVIEIPTSWNIMIYSEETSQVDVATARDLTRYDYTALVYEHDREKVIPGKINVIDYHQESLVQTPSLNRKNMLCHHIGHEYWVCIAPTDNYNKYFKNKLVGDLLA